MKRRVVVTGVGVVAPNGLGKEAFWQALTHGLSGVRSIRRFDSSQLSSRIAGEIVDFDPLQYFEAQELKKMDRGHLYAIVASLFALQDSGLELAHEDAERIGSSVGNAACGIESTQNESEVIWERGPRWGSPYFAISFFPCGANGVLSIRLKIKGPVLTFCNGNTSGTDAIGAAYQMIRSGRAEIMFAGGAEAPLVPLLIESMARDGWLSTQNEIPEGVCRPFDQSASGMVLGEGAGMLLLEDYEHARSRGATCYAEIGGYFNANSAFHPVNPESNGGGLVRSMKEVLLRCNLSPQNVDFINAQGLSLLNYDHMESRCMNEVFSGTFPAARISAVSSYIGNSMGALGGIQGVVSALALHHQLYPPHPVLGSADPSLKSRLVGPQAEAGNINVVLQNSYCFMGKHSSLIFKKV
jgi:3-oxoacyl-[acyl-carrier-protein] synthase II